MKFKCGFIFILLFQLLVSEAQQRPYYTQYILNNYIINPAVAGIENYADVKLSHRLQWVGLQDAPVTTYFTIHAPLKKNNYDVETATTFHASGKNPRGEAYWKEYTKAEPHAGIGGTILNDRTGPLNRFAAYATYAYHIGIAPQTSLSLGVSAGVNQLSLSADKLNFATPSDPAVSGILSTIKPDISAGVWLYSRDYFLGLAAQQIVPQRVTFANDSVSLQNGKLIPHIFISAGYRIFLSEDVSFLPSVLLRYVNPLPLGLDFNAKFQYQDLIWGGFSYRYQDGVAISLGVNFSHSINLGYSYDYTTSQLNTVSKGTHEIVLGFLLGNKYGDWCPRNLW